MKGDRNMPNMLDTLAQSDRFNVLVNAIYAAGMADRLRGEGQYTLFAPTDKAFAKLSRTTLREMMHNPDKLQNVITFHLALGRYYAEDVAAIEELQSMQGEKITIHASPKLSVEHATIVETDIECENGVIHYIDQVMTPRSVQVEV